MSELTEFPLTTAAQMPEDDWTDKNPELAQFQMGIESDTGKCKVNFGPPTRRNDLGYWNPAGGVQIVTTTVQTNVGTKQALLAAVPAGKVRIVTMCIPRNATADLTAMSDEVLFGFNAGANDWGGATDYRTSFVPLVEPEDMAYCLPSQGNTTKAGQVGEIFGIHFADTAITATLDIDVHYYDVDAPSE